MREEFTMIKASDVREIALALPDARERGHHDVTDFRVADKIFCTLPKKGWLGLRITANEQAALVAERPDTFVPASGQWGKRGWTLARMDDIDRTHAQELIAEAWRYRAPKKLLTAYDAGEPVTAPDQRS
jgi:hypothetical protein